MTKKLGLSFYHRSALEVAPDLIGKVFVRKTPTGLLRGRITEVEAYMGEEDKASHNYGGLRTERTEAMYRRPGYLYIYLIYGMYDLINVVTGAYDIGQAVLIRSLEPLDDLDPWALNRYQMPYDDLTSYQQKNLANGPGKLSQAIKLTVKDNLTDLLEDEVYIEDDGFKPTKIDRSKRIGIDYAEEAADYLYRFELGDPSPQG